MPEPARGSIDAPIGRDARHRTRMAVVAAGRDARTDYEVERVHHDPVTVALVRCRLHTGRTHQVRVHLAAIGHPVVGDRRYGGWRESLPLARTFLHSAVLTFVHPGSAETVTFESDLPPELVACLGRLS
ncbi:MAG: pseudouridine synthase [Acidimicrobiia bacterium]|nr:pseudouridine synthase [Acidimicrobiia bacterium]